MPRFGPGENIAMKVPADQFQATVEFYRDVLGLRPVLEEQPDWVFEFGGKRLWIDRREDLPRAEIWLEVATDDRAAAAAYLAESGVARRDDVERLPSGFNGFWICNPAGIVHLVSGE